ncbi:uncharacterized protein LOC128224850 [Mya arenaria]|uniref:uncharacterized protein LOC128224850 n=1 Tax=Mya arenaria TaxID=6604 RepID=UPI0022E48FF0|nr:uncharacterized protein LOC128224850 [Mya arenaria]
MSEKVADTDIAMEEIQGDGKRLTAAEIPIATTRTSDPPTDTSIMADSAPDEVESNAWAGLLKFFSTIFIIHFFPFSLLCSLKTAQEYERAVIFACGESYMAAQKDQSAVYPARRQPTVGGLSGPSATISRRSIRPIGNQHSGVYPSRRQLSVGGPSGPSATNSWRSIRPVGNQQSAVYPAGRQPSDGGLSGPSATNNRRSIRPVGTIFARCYHIFVLSGAIIYTS